MTMLWHGDIHCFRQFVLARLLWGVSSQGFMRLLSKTLPWCCRQTRERIEADRAAEEAEAAHQAALQVAPPCHQTSATPLICALSMRACMTKLMRTLGPSG